MVSRLQTRVDRHRAGGHAGAAADDHHRLRLRRHQRREVAEHPLQTHVLRLARRLNLAGVVIVEHAVRQPRHRHRRHHPFALVDDLVGLPGARRRVASVGDRARPGPRARVRASSTAATAIATTRPPAGDHCDAGCSSLVIRARPTAQHQQRRHKRRDDQHLLGMLAADPRHEHEAGGQRADDGADGVGGIDAADQPRRILAGRRDRRQRQRKARAPQDRARAAPPTGSARGRAAS